jgi:hypothetical protein
MYSMDSAIGQGLFLITESVIRAKRNDGTYGTSWAITSAVYQTAVAWIAAFVESYQGFGALVRGPAAGLAPDVIVGAPGAFCIGSAMVFVEEVAYNL